MGADEYEKVITDDGKLIMEVDPSFYRPAEVHKLRGDCSLGKKNLVGLVFGASCKRMYNSDYEQLKDRFKVKIFVAGSSGWSVLGCEKLQAENYDNIVTTSKNLDCNQADVNAFLQNINRCSCNSTRLVEYWQITIFVVTSF